MKRLLAVALTGAVIASGCGGENAREDEQVVVKPQVATQYAALTLRKCGNGDLFTCIDLTKDEACNLANAVKIGGSAVQSVIGGSAIIAAAVMLTFYLHEDWIRGTIGTEGEELDFNPFLGIITEYKTRGEPCPDYCSTGTCPSGGVTDNPYSCEYPGGEVCKSGYVCCTCNVPAFCTTASQCRQACLL